MDRNEFDRISKKFYGKLLLFGEYGIILNAKGLAIPLQKYYGAFQYAKAIDKQIAASYKVLKELGTFIQQKLPADVQRRFDNARFENDVDKQLYFASNIPQGYGAGSSGALVAALYTKYFEKATDEKSLKNDLGLLENFFHGTSSGYDPLVSYLNQPIIIHEDKAFQKVHLRKESMKIHPFLVDTGIARKTKGFVRGFLQQLEDDEYKQQFEDEFIQPSNRAIESFVGRKPDVFFQSVRQVSSYQLNQFEKLVPGNLSEAFIYGLESGDFYLKLCGAGGGGYFLGFTYDMDLANHYFARINLPVIPF